MKIKRWLSGILLLSLLALGGYWWLRPAPELPDMALTTLKGEPIRLRAWLGKPVIVTFWASDCPACIREIPDLQALYQELHPKGLEMLAIAMAYDPPSHVVAMAEAKQLAYPVSLDVRGEYELAFGQVALTPTTFLIGPDGKILHRYLGLFDANALKNHIISILQG